MATDLLELLTDKSKPGVWLDSWAYCRKLFIGGTAAPWNNSTDFDNFIRKTDSLLHPTVTCVPLGDFLRTTTSELTGLRDEMGAKQRTGYALKTLLRDEEIRRRFSNALHLASEAITTKPLVITVPSPRFLVGWAYELAHGPSDKEITVDHADSASVYLSDFLTALSTSGICGVLVEELCPGNDEWSEESSIYTPLRNVTQHMQWKLGVRLPFAPTEESQVTSFDFIVCADESVPTNVVHGKWMSDASESDKHPTEPGSFSYWDIPEDAVPEEVLKQRTSLGIY